MCEFLNLHPILCPKAPVLTIVYLLLALCITFQDGANIVMVQAHKTISDDEDEMEVMPNGEESGMHAGDAIVDDMGEAVEENIQMDDESEMDDEAS